MRARSLWDPSVHVPKKATTKSVKRCSTGNAGKTRAATQLSSITGTSTDGLDASSVEGTQNGDKMSRLEGTKKDFNTTAKLNCNYSPSNQGEMIPLVRKLKTPQATTGSHTLRLDRNA